MEDKICGRFDRVNNKTLHAIPIELREANDFVNKLHRHHEAAQSCRNGRLKNV
jgi:hypothetical protein